ncbi:hypothetical protein BDR26DRAFT_875159 [Obelidium mucronatum]|nr:hypothetical protein BDR26DRAFT_875159 [Obelidium mucronatum]
MESVFPMISAIVFLLSATAASATTSSKEPQLGNLIQNPNFTNICDKNTWCINNQNNGGPDSIKPWKVSACRDLSSPELIQDCKPGEYEGELSLFPDKSLRHNIDLNPNGPGGVYQDVSIPKNYSDILLHFDLNFNQFCPPLKQGTVRVKLTHVSTGHILFSTRFTTSSAGGSPGWTTIPLQIHIGKDHIDGASLIRLSFLSETLGSCGPMLTNVYLGVQEKCSVDDVGYDPVRSLMKRDASSEEYYHHDSRDGDHHHSLSIEEREEHHIEGGIVSERDDEQNGDSVSIRDQEDTETKERNVLDVRDEYASYIPNERDDDEEHVSHAARDEEVRDFDLDERSDEARDSEEDNIHERDEEERDNATSNLDERGRDEEYDIRDHAGGARDFEVDFSVRDEQERDFDNSELNERDPDRDEHELAERDFLGERVNFEPRDVDSIYDYELRYRDDLTDAPQDHLSSRDFESKGSRLRDSDSSVEERDFDIYTQSVERKDSVAANDLNPDLEKRCVNHAGQNSKRCVGTKPARDEINVGIGFEAHLRRRRAYPEI